MPQPVQVDMPATALAVQAEDIKAAAQRLSGHARSTPILPLIGTTSTLPAFVKCENLQIGGAFKFRGAFNRLEQLSVESRRAGVVAWSSGNHAQGVAAAGRKLGIACTIVMPADAPSIKIVNTRALGAEVILYDRLTQNREEIAHALARERGATLVPSYDDPHVIAGQGTVALEFDAQVRASADRPLDILLVPCGGGGLVAGCAIALANVSPHTHVYAVEPQQFDDTCRSLESGHREHIVATSRSICDALLAPTPGDLTWPINQHLLAGGLRVSDEQVRAAMLYAWRELKLVVEPGGAVALAAWLHGLLDCRDRTVGIVLSGGNVDPHLYREVLA